jgi:hypothetical protein
MSRSNKTIIVQPSAQHPALGHHPQPGSWQRLPLASVGSLLTRIFGDEKPDPWERPNRGSFRVHSIAGDGRCMFRAMVSLLLLSTIIWAGSVVCSIVRVHSEV